MDLNSILHICGYINTLPYAMHIILWERSGHIADVMSINSLLMKKITRSKLRKMEEEMFSKHLIIQLKVID